MLASIKESVFSSTAGQLYNFTIFVASLVLTVNNILDLNFSISNTFFYSVNITVIYDVMLIICSFYIMICSVETPFSVRETTAEVESLSTIMYFIAMVYSSASTVVEDPNILFTSTFDIINENFGNQPLNLKIDIFKVERDVMHTTGLAFLTMVNFSKLVIIITAFIYLIAITTYTKPIINKKQISEIKSSIVWRVILIAIVTFNCVITIKNASLDKSSLDHLQNSVELLNSYNASSISMALMEPSFQNTLEDISIFMFILTSYYILIFYEHYEYSLFCILALTLQNVVKLDKLLQDGFMFDSAVVIFFVSCVLLCGHVSVLLYDNRSELKYFVNFLPSVMYKVGLILCIVSLFFVILAYNYEWFDFKYEPSGISKEAADFIQSAADKIDTVVDDISSVARVLDPCSRRRFPDIPDTDVINDISDIEETLEEARRRASLSDSNLGICVSKQDPFNFVDFGNNRPSQCSTLESDLNDMEADLIAAFNQHGDDDFKELDDLDDEFYVDQRCAQIACTSLTAITAAALATSWVPFGSAATAAASFAARGAFRVFRMGRRITRYLPRMVKKKRKVEKLARRIRKLAIATRASTRFSKEIAVIFLPVILLASISLTLLMFRRSVKQDVGSASTNGIKFIIGVFGPVSIVELAFFIALSVVPNVIQSVLDTLPDEFVVGTVEVGIGYTCLRFAYFLSFVGAILSVVGVLLMTYNNYIIYLFNKIVDKYKNRKVNTETNYAKKSIDFLLNWNAIYFQPLVFCLPSLYWIFNAFFTQPKYVIISYGSNDDVARANDELLETSLQRERSEGFDMEFDETACGAVAKLVVEILKAVGGLDKIKNLLSGFTSALQEGFDGVLEFIETLGSLIDLDLVEIDIPPFSVLLGAFGVLVAFALPIVCIGALFYLWYISVVKRNVVSNDDSAGVVGYGIDSSVAVFVFFLSIMNVVGHYILSGILLSVFNTPMPFIKVNAEMGPCFYDTQLASLFTLIASISLYVNILLPPA